MECGRVTQLAFGSSERQEITILLLPVLTIGFNLDLLHYYQPRAGYVPMLKTIPIEWLQT